MKPKTILTILLVAVTLSVQAQIINLGNPESFESLLKQNFTGKTVYIDVMASWCKPCLAELPASKELDNYFKEHNIARLFITIDNPDDIDNCMNLLNKYDLSGYLATYHQQEKRSQNKFSKEVETLFMRDEEGNLAISVPKYAIVDTKGNIVVKKAERPSNPDLLKKQLQGVITAQAQEITEENYLKIDKEIWDTYYTKIDSISAQFKLHPENKDSLIKESEIIYNTASLKNIETAIKYATVPSGLQRLFMVRLDIPKDTIKAVWNRLPQEMKLSPYGKSILMHIENKQLEEGDTYIDFEATDANGQPFNLYSLSGKNILLFYGGLDCMGESGRNNLVSLYENTSRDNFEVVVYNTVSSLENLKKAKDEYNVNFIMVSDFLQDHTPFKIIYGAQTRPTVFLINNEGKIVLKTTGRNFKKELDRFRDKL